MIPYASLRLAFIMHRVKERTDNAVPLTTADHYAMQLLYFCPEEGCACVAVAA